MLLSKDPRDLATAEAYLTLVLLTEAEASGSNLILSPPPIHSQLVSVIFSKHLLSPIFFNASPSRCRRRPSLLYC